MSEENNPPPDYRRPAARRPRSVAENAAGGARLRSPESQAKAVASRRANRDARRAGLSPVRTPDIMTLQQAAKASMLSTKILKIARDRGWLRCRDFGGPLGLRITRRALYDLCEGVVSHHIDEIPIQPGDDDTLPLDRNTEHPDDEAP